MAFRIQQGTNENRRRRVFIHLVDATDGITAKTGQTGTAIVIDSNLAVKATTNSIVEVNSSNAPGLYYVELTTQEVQNVGPMQIRFKNASTAEFQDLGEIVVYDPYDQKNVFNPWQQVTGQDIDYKRIEKMIGDRVAAIPPIQPVEKTDLNPVLKAIGSLAERIDAIDIPEAKETDLTPIVEGLQAILKEVRDIEMPEYKETDLTPVMDCLNKLKEHTGESAEAAELMRSSHEKLEGTPERLTAVIDKIEDALDMKKMRDTFSKISEAKEQAEEKPESISKHLKLV